MQTVVSCTGRSRFSGFFVSRELRNTAILLPLRFRPGQSGLGRNERGRVVAECSQWLQIGLTYEPWMTIFSNKTNWGLCPSNRRRDSYFPTTAAWTMLDQLHGLIVFHGHCHEPHWWSLLKQNNGSVGLEIKGQEAVFLCPYKSSLNVTCSLPDGSDSLLVQGGIGCLHWWISASFS